ncbi:MAG: copper chaperone PCu(A)C [Aeromonas sp.]
MLTRTFFSLLVLGMSAAAQAKIDVADGYVRLLPPGSPNTAAFMVLSNDADKPVKLVGATSQAAKRAELHTHLHENGVMKMRQVPSIEIPAKGQVALTPGGMHIMLFDIAPLSELTPVPLTLTMDDGQQLVVPLPVKPIEPTSSATSMTH